MSIGDIFFQRMKIAKVTGNQLANGETHYSILKIHVHNELHVVH